MYAGKLMEHFHIPIATSDISHPELLASPAQLGPEGVGWMRLATEAAAKKDDRKG